MKLCLLLIPVLVVATAKAAPVPSTGCAESAEAAVAQLLTNSIAGKDTQGFRVDAIRVDRIHHQKWAMVASCAEPAKPLVALLLPHSAAVTHEVQRVAVAVRNGDRVIVVSGSGDSLMQLTGSALESGAIGQRVRVRLQFAMQNSIPSTIECKVLRTGVVEVSR